MTLTDEEVKALWDYLKNQWIDPKDFPLAAKLIRRISLYVHMNEIEDGDGL